jgi:hypothetical protein
VPIPPTALVLSLAGLLPFLWGVATMLSPALSVAALAVVPPMLVGEPVLHLYGLVILCFMSGVLWGFAARAEGRAAAQGFALSVIPALWALFTAAGPGAAVNLGAGFVAVLMLDALFWAQGLAPRWWLRLRVPMTAAVLGCLSIPALG